MCCGQVPPINERYDANYCRLDRVIAWASVFIARNTAASMNAAMDAVTGPLNVEVQSLGRIGTGASTTYGRFRLSSVMIPRPIGLV